MNLPSEHPEVYCNFMAGKFAVQLAEGSPFTRIPVDQTTKVTVNKDTKTSGGVTKDRSCEQILHDGRIQMLFPCPSEKHGSGEATVLSL